MAIWGRGNRSPKGTGLEPGNRLAREARFQELLAGDPSIPPWQGPQAARGSKRKGKSPKFFTLNQLVALTWGERTGEKKKKAGDGLGLVSLTSFLQALSLDGAVCQRWMKSSLGCNIRLCTSKELTPVAGVQSQVIKSLITLTRAACQLCEFHKHPAFSHFRTLNYPHSL